MRLPSAAADASTDPGDAARIELLLAELRLPAVKLVWASLAAQADKRYKRLEGGVKR
jgi:hypothetical protein